MTLFGLVAVLIIVGVLLWAIKSLPFIDANIKQVIYVVVIVFVALWLMSALLGYTVPNVRLK